jgi:hypothetical protein
MSLANEGFDDEGLFARADVLAARLIGEAGINPAAMMVPHADVVAIVRKALLHGGRIVMGDLTGDRHCRVCGCTDLCACRPEPCHWSDAATCSVCAAYARAEAGA